MGNACINYVGTDRTAVEIPLKVTDIKQLKESWTIIKPKWDEISKVAFRRWFESYPEIWRMFSTSAKDIDELLESRAIARHSQKFEELIEIVIYNLDQRAKLVQSLIDYGKFHHSFGAQQRFATTLATSLKFAVFSNLKNEHGLDDCKTQDAWDSLFSFLSGLLKLGMRKAKEEVRADGRQNEMGHQSDNIFKVFGTGT